MDLRLSDRMSLLTGSATREILKLTANPNIISFAGGLPANEGLPTDIINRITNDVLTGPDAAKVLQYGVTDGLLSLRRALVGYLAGYGIKGIDEGNILVVSGGQQGIDLACKVFLNKGDKVLVEDPTYLATLQIIKAYEAEPIGVHATEEGLDLDDLERKIIANKPKILYVVPTFSNPTGKTYSEENRKKIAEITARHNVIVVEDDPYSQLRFEGKAVPSLKSLGGENVIFVSSFSKIISPGLRVGLVCADKSIIRKLEISKQVQDVHTPNLNQAIVERFITEGLIAPHLEKVLPIYKERKDCMQAALEKYMPKEAKFTKPEGGLFIWGEINADINMNELFPRAIQAQVAYVYGNVFYAANGGLNTFRLNFSNADCVKIDAGIKSLAELIQKSL